MKTNKAVICSDSNFENTRFKVDCLSNLYCLKLSLKIRKVPIQPGAPDGAEKRKN